MHIVVMLLVTLIRIRRINCCLFADFPDLIYVNSERYACMYFCSQALPGALRSSKSLRDNLECGYLTRDKLSQVDGKLLPVISEFARKMECQGQ